MKETFDPSRRELLTMMMGLPFATSLSRQQELEKFFPVPVGEFPHKELFDIKGTYINAAYIHPMNRKSQQAIAPYLDERMINGHTPHYDMDENRKTAKENFARLINADVEEIAWVPSTMAGENAIVNGLSLPGSKGRVVTDAYHFSGSLYMYTELAKQGLDVHVVKPRDNKINLDDLEAAITPGTKLVAISLVSAFNGFEHDLKKVCAIAHAKNALVFADIIQAAGAVPIDVKDSGVDFCSSATYKWLMGDFGQGFLYARKDKLGLLRRSQLGYRQEAKFVSHIYPFDDPGTVLFETESRNDAPGYFEVGTFSNAAIAALRQSLDYLLKTEPAKIQQYRKPMLDILQQKLPGLGFMPLTPVDSTSPIVAFGMKDAYEKLKPKIDAAGINIQLYKNRIRISPSVYNDMDDINKLIKALS
ncbi:MAG TPA: aminotransferase class V-fold PLP-dependent enzyme [Chitinophagaceae bacterium]|nr:aminotransferase class V-fold PLP-dependent enzyme [Chitinophagaceae bacterium]